MLQLGSNWSGAKKGSSSWDFHSVRHSMLRVRSSPDWTRGSFAPKQSSRQDGNAGKLLQSFICSLATQSLPRAKDHLMTHFRDLDVDETLLAEYRKAFPEDEISVQQKIT